MTTRLNLNRAEIGAILPGLARMVNGIATLRLRGQSNVLEMLNKHVYADNCFDEEMYGYLLSCRNKLKSIGTSKKVRLNAFEIAAAGLALRVVRKLGLARPAVSSGEALAALAHKLELHRKRAKRGGIRKLGPDDYRLASRRWRNFVGWIRLKLLVPPSRGLIFTTGVTMLKRDQREQMRQLIRDVVVPGTPEADIRRWAELARREIWRGRHATTLREFLSNHDKARLFLAEFVMRRTADVRTLRPEFIPRSIRASIMWNFKASLSRPEANPPSTTTPSIPSDSPVVALNEACSTAEAVTSAFSLEPGALAPGTEDELGPELVYDKKTLVELLEGWFVDEVDPGFYECVADEIRHQVWHYYRIHAMDLAPTSPTDVIVKKRPVYDIPIADSNELVGYLAGWASDWLLALNPDPLVVHDAVGPAMASAQNHLKAMDTLTFRSKITEIHRRYFL